MEGRPACAAAPSDLRNDPGVIWQSPVLSDGSDLGTTPSRRPGDSSWLLLERLGRVGRGGKVLQVRQEFRSYLREVRGQGLEKGRARAGFLEMLS